MSHKRVRLPRSVRVGQQTIPVRLRSLPRDIWGFTTLNDPDAEIQVSRRLHAPRSILATVLHESLHHAFPDLSERRILQMEQRLLRLIQDNPGLIRQLLATFRR